MRLPAISDPLTRAWLALMLLSGASRLIAVFRVQGLAQVAVGGVVLALVWLKARVILSDYLGLRQAPTWRAGLNGVLAVYCALLLGLYLIPVFNV